MYPSRITNSALIRALIINCVLPHVLISGAATQFRGLCSFCCVIIRSICIIPLCDKGYIVPLKALAHGPIK